MEGNEMLKVNMVKVVELLKKGNRLSIFRVQVWLFIPCGGIHMPMRLSKKAD